MGKSFLNKVPHLKKKRKRWLLGRLNLTDNEEKISFSYNEKKKNFWNFISSFFLLNFAEI